MKVAAKYEVKKVKDGVGKGEWGVYKDGNLQISFKRKSAATNDMNRRKTGN